MGINTRSKLYPNTPYDQHETELAKSYQRANQEAATNEDVNTMRTLESSGSLGSRVIKPGQTGARYTTGKYKGMTEGEAMAAARSGSNSTASPTDATGRSVGGSKGMDLAAGFSTQQQMHDEYNQDSQKLLAEKGYDTGGSGDRVAKSQDEIKADAAKGVNWSAMNPAINTSYTGAPEKQFTQVKDPMAPPTQAPGQGNTGTGLVDVNSQNKAPVTVAMADKSATPPPTAPAPAPTGPQPATAPVVQSPINTAPSLASATSNSLQGAMNYTMNPNPTLPSTSNPKVMDYSNLQTSTPPAMETGVQKSNRLAAEEEAKKKKSQLLASNTQTQ